MLIVAVAVFVVIVSVTYGIAPLLDTYFPANWRTSLPATLGFFAACYFAARIEKLESNVRELSGRIAQLQRLLRP